MISLKKFTPALLLAALLIPVGCSNPKSSSSPAQSASASQTPASSQPSVSPTTAPSASASPAAAPSASPAQPVSTAKPAEPAAAGPGGTVTAMRLASAKAGWAGGEGWIDRTDDGGKHWQNQYLGSAVISQIFALNDQNAWAETDKGNLLSTADGGKHWADAGTVPNKAFLHFTSKTEAFAGNARTTDGGKTWSTLPIQGPTVGDPYFHDSANGWAVIQNNGMGIVEHTADGGKTWQNVMGLKLDSQLTGAVIRSAGTNDAWVEWIGGSGMSQTSYSLFHTTDGGKSWITVLANSTAGAGPAPGITDDSKASKNQGSKPGPLYVVDTNTAYMGGDCPACDKSKTVGHTLDGGKTWINGTAAYPGYGEALLGMADAKSGWWIINDNSGPSVMYTTADAGAHWNTVYTFPAKKAK